jgi:hypothetical protein
MHFYSRHKKEAVLLQRTTANRHWIGGMLGPRAGLGLVQMATEPKYGAPSLMLPKRDLDVTRM